MSEFNDVTEIFHCICGVEDSFSGDDEWDCMSSAEVAGWGTDSVDEDLCPKCNKRYGQWLGTKMGEEKSKGSKMDNDMNGWGCW